MNPSSSFLTSQCQHPPLPTNHTEHKQWIEDLANIGKTAKIKAYKIIAKQTMINCKIAITIYRALLNIKPKAIHKTNNQKLPRLHTKSQGNILTKPMDIANKIYCIQQTSFQRQSPICDDTTYHLNTCMCAIRKYPCQIQEDIILDKRGPQNAQINTQFIQEIYDNRVKMLTKGKAPGLDNIPNDILIKVLPQQCQNLIYQFFQHCYKQQEIPTYWNNKTIILHKKRGPHPPHQLQTNHLTKHNIQIIY